MADSNAIADTTNAIEYQYFILLAFELSVETGVGPYMVAGRNLLQESCE